MYVVILVGSLYWPTVYTSNYIAEGYQLLAVREMF